jgi:hypothetical protein
VLNKELGNQQKNIERSMLQVLSFFLAEGSWITPEDYNFWNFWVERLNIAIDYMIAPVFLLYPHHLCLVCQKARGWALEVDIFLIWDCIGCLWNNSFNKNIATLAF